MTDEDLKIATTRPFRWPGSAKSASDATAGLPKSRKSASLSVGTAGIRRMSVNPNKLKATLGEGDA